MLVFDMFPGNESTSGKFPLARQAVHRQTVQMHGQLAVKAPARNSLASLSCADLMRELIPCKTPFCVISGVEPYYSQA